MSVLDIMKELTSPPPTPNSMRVDLDKFNKQFTALRAEIQQTRASLPNPWDYPSTWSDRKREATDQHRQNLDAAQSQCLRFGSEADAALKSVGEYGAAYERLTWARAALQRRLKATPTDPGLLDALDATEIGFTTNVNSDAILPDALRELLTDRCNLGHTHLLWKGPMPLLERKMSEARQVLAMLPGALNAVRAQIAPPK